MKRINYIFTTLLALMAVTFCGCSDDVSLSSPAGGDEMFDGIVVRIPDPKGLAVATTRAQSNASQIALLEKEGTINSLHLFAFPGGDGDAVSVDLLTKERIDKLPVHGGVEYQNFDITDEFKGKKGTWKFYIVANLEDYGVRLSDIKQESDLLNAELNFFKGEGENREYLLSQAKIEKEGGLPMACLATDMQFRTEGGTLSPVAGGQFVIPSNGKAEIHADLTFLCSKVRYTVFFDKTQEPTKGVFGDDLSFNLTEVKATNILTSGTTVGADKTYEAASTVAIAKNMLNACQYPSNANDYPEAGEEFKPLSDLEGAADFSKRAWQGVAYLPENSNGEKRTTLQFLANAVKRDGEKGSTLNYTMSLLPAENDNYIKRGYAYDIVAKVTKVDELEVINFNVQPWTAIALQYSLTPPAYLHVDKTEIEVKAGDRTSIWYESNADITFESPKYGEVDIYTLTKTEDQIVVSVNPNLPVSSFEDIRNDKEGKYTYFHVIAGNIIKKIDVTDLDLNVFLTVDPINYTIDVREQVGSGKYEGEYVMTVETNLDEFKLTDLNWLTAKPARGENLTLYVNEGEEWVAVDLSKENTFTPDKGVRTFKIVYTGLNDGAALWTASQDLKFSVSAEGVTSHTVTTYIRPSMDKYIIHFRDNENWDNPHIYVYQCLEIPATWNKTVVKDGNTYNLASMPVGYSHDGDVMAALEYCFTGAIAFKGWQSAANNASLNDYAKGWSTQGFWIFSDGWYGGNDQCSWNPNHALSDSRYEKGESVDFCKDYRKTIVGCDRCKVGTGNPSWPGIRMEREDNGWWKFELTGVATPGRTLIMFTNGHEYVLGQPRYPGDNKVGIPLFDYPSHEGWIELKFNEPGHSLRDDIAFVSQKPDGNSGVEPEPGVDPKPKTHKLYITNNIPAWSEIWAYNWGGPGEIFGGWPGKKAQKEGNYYVVEFEPTGGGGNLIINNNNGQQTFDFTNISYDKDVYITINEANIK